MEESELASDELLEAELPFDKELLLVLDVPTPQDVRDRNNAVDINNCVFLIDLAPLSIYPNEDIKNENQSDLVNWFPLDCCHFISFPGFLSSSAPDMTFSVSRLLLSSY